MKKQDRTAWAVLLVAGGGGGGYHNKSGWPGNDKTYGSSSGSSEGNRGASEGHSVNYTLTMSSWSSGGRGFLSSWEDMSEDEVVNSLKNGFYYGNPEGSSSSNFQKSFIRGGFGFGAGGSAASGVGGGGGGYSGGGEGDGGMGGGSYVNEQWARHSTIKQNWKSKEHKDGQVQFQFFQHPDITIDNFSFPDNFKLAVDGSSASGLYFTEKFEGPLGLNVPKIKLPADGLSSATMYPGTDINLTFVDKEAPSQYFNKHYFAYFLENGHGMVVSEDPVDIQAVGGGSINYKVSFKYYANTDLKFYWYYKKKKDDDTYIPLGKSKKGEYEYDPGNEGKVEIAFNEAPN